MNRKVLFTVILVLAAAVSYQTLFAGKAAQEGAPPPWPLFNAVHVVQHFFENVAPNWFTPPPLRMLRLAYHFADTKVLTQLAKMQIADQLAAGPLSLQALAERNAVDADRLERLLRYAMNLGVFTEVGAAGSKVFTNNALSSTLRSDDPNSMRNILIHFGEETYDAWQAIDYTLRHPYSEPTTFEHTHNGMDVWKFFESRPEMRDNFAKAMSNVDKVAIQPVVQDFEWKKFQRVLDIGGSLGGLLQAVMYANPHVQGVLFDLPSIAENAKNHWPAHNGALMNRVNIHGGSFMDAATLPKSVSDKDAYVMRFILHDWKDEDCIKILKNIHSAMGSHNATLLLVEQVLNVPETRLMSTFLDLQMLTYFDGRERNLNNHWRPLLAAAGFEIIAVHPTRSLHSVIEARKISGATTGATSAAAENHSNRAEVIPEVTVPAVEPVVAVESVPVEEIPQPVEL